MKKKLTKVLVLVLGICMLSTCLAGCGVKTADADDNEALIHQSESALDEIQEQDEQIPEEDPEETLEETNDVTEEKEIEVKTTDGKKVVKVLVQTDLNDTQPAAPVTQQDLGKTDKPVVPSKPVVSGENEKPADEGNQSTEDEQPAEPEVKPYTPPENLGEMLTDFTEYRLRTTDKNTNLNFYRHGYKVSESYKDGCVGYDGFYDDYPYTGEVMLEDGSILYLTDGRDANGNLYNGNGYMESYISYADLFVKNSNPDVCTVVPVRDSDRTYFQVNPKAVGESYITATSSNGDRRTVHITVTEPENFYAEGKTCPVCGEGLLYEDGSCSRFCHNYASGYGQGMYDEETQDFVVQCLGCGEKISCQAVGASGLSKLNFWSEHMKEYEARTGEEHPWCSWENPEYVERFEELYGNGVIMFEHIPGEQSSIRFEQPSMSLTVGEQVQTTIKSFEGDVSSDIDMTNHTVCYTSTNPDVASAEAISTADGCTVMITAKGPGSTYINAWLDLSCIALEVTVNEDGTVDVAQADTDDTTDEVVDDQVLDETIVETDAESTVDADVATSEMVDEAQTIADDVAENDADTVDAE